MSKILGEIARLQKTSLFGYTYGQGDMYEQYMGFGAAMVPYDFDAPGAVAEAKRAMMVLAQATPGITERTWTRLTNDDAWDEAAGEEFLLAMSRYRGRTGLNWPTIDGPYTQQGLEGGVPQPAVNGLELLAGAVENLAPNAKMVLYETWRSTGCTLCIAPPSNVSKPSVDTIVLLARNGGPNRVVVPGEAPMAFAAVVKGFDAQLDGLWQVALVAPDEPTRDAVSVTMQQTQQARDSAAKAAINASPGKPVLPASAATSVPDEGSSTKTWLLLGAVGLGAWWLYARGKR